LKNAIIKDDLAAFKEQIAAILSNQNSRDAIDQDVTFGLEVFNFLYKNVVSLLADLFYISF
jgi:hypothetical protein